MTAGLQQAFITNPLRKQPTQAEESRPSRCPAAENDRPDRSGDPRVAAARRDFREPLSFARRRVRSAPSGFPPWSERQLRMNHELQRCLDEAFAMHGRRRTFAKSSRYDELSALKSNRETTFLINADLQGEPAPGSDVADDPNPEPG